MRRRYVLVWALIALGGCGGTQGGGDASAPRTTTVDAVRQARLMATGERVFAKQCSFCHRLLGIRAPRTPPPDAYGPNFDETRPTKAYVLERVTDGFGGMQSFQGDLTRGKIDAVATYVAAVSGRNLERPGLTGEQLAAGEAVFEAHCRKCHTLARRALTGKPGWTPTDFNDVQVSAPYTRSLLDGTGNAFFLELMVKAQGLAPQQIHDVAEYVAAISGPAHGRP